MAEPIQTLADLRGLRTAPNLTAEQRQYLRDELTTAMATCPWFTIGVMAPSADQALAALRRWERAFGWEPLLLSDPRSADSDGPIEGPVYLKGHQANGSCWLRHEEGLGEGVLISGQHPDQPELGQTWGPLPLDLL
jgi:hypothetical protein